MVVTVITDFHRPCRSAQQSALLPRKQPGIRKRIHFFRRLLYLQQLLCIVGKIVVLFIKRIIVRFQKTDRFGKFYQTFVGMRKFEELFGKIDLILVDMLLWISLLLFRNRHLLVC